ncbi:hypothetical protein [Stenotrophomonas pavanii]
MDILIIVLALVALGHFLYEGAVAPTLRTKLKHEMFQLRDELRSVHLERAGGCPQEAFNIVHNGINQYVHRLHWVTISFISEFNRMNSKAKRAEVDRRKKVVEECGVKELSDIAARGNKVLESALFVNSGALLAYCIALMVPLAILFLCAHSIYRKASEMFAAPSGRTDEVMSKLV